MEPQQIGRYLIQARLGQGGMGTVYRALNPRVNRLVALKTIPITDLAHRTRFERGLMPRANDPKAYVLLDKAVPGK